MMPPRHLFAVWFALRLLRVRLPSRRRLMVILWMVDMIAASMPHRAGYLLQSWRTPRALMVTLRGGYGARARAPRGFAPRRRRPAPRPLAPACARAIPAPGRRALPCRG